MVPAGSCRISRVPHYSGAVSTSSLFSPKGLSPAMAGFSKAVRLTVSSVFLTVLQPPSCRNSLGLGCCAFARHYLRNHFCFLFLRLLRCFSSPGLPSALRSTTLKWWVAPFGNPCLCGYLPLGTAYRSLSRPSSPPRAKASFMCPFLLSFFFWSFICNAFLRWPSLKTAGLKVLFASA